jgi:hypothetical protein
MAVFDILTRLLSDTPPRSVQPFEDPLQGLVWMSCAQETRSTRFPWLGDTEQELPNCRLVATDTGIVN